METEPQPIEIQNPPKPEEIAQALEAVKNNKKRSNTRFVLAALGSIPWVGGLLGALAARDAEKEQSHVNQLQQLWIEQHEEKMGLLGYTIFQILKRFGDFEDEIQNRIESQEYLTLVGKAFRTWDKANTNEKRDLIKNLLSNAGATKLCTDDLIRLFIDWIDRYSEAHFKVIKAIYQNKGITRGGIWDSLHDQRPREDAYEADLFRLLISDLQLGRVIRQERRTNMAGQFVRKRTSSPRGSTLESAFEDTKPYELTQLGEYFVHYTMTDLAPRLEGKNVQEQPEV